MRSKLSAQSFLKNIENFLHKKNVDLQLYSHDHLSKNIKNFLCTKYNPLLNFRMRKTCRINTRDMQNLLNKQQFNNHDSFSKISRHSTA